MGRGPRQIDATQDSKTEARLFFAPLALSFARVCARPFHTHTRVTREREERTEAKKKEPTTRCHPHHTIVAARCCCCFSFLSFPCFCSSRLAAAASCGAALWSLAANFTCPPPRLSHANQLSTQPPHLNIHATEASCPTTNSSPPLSSCPASSSFPLCPFPLPSPPSSGADGGGCSTKEAGG